jgi:hypothetical protein
LGFIVLLGLVGPWDRQHRKRLPLEEKALALYDKRKFEMQE